MNQDGRESYFFDDYQLDLQLRSLHKQGEAVKLTPKAFDLLLAFVENQGKILSKNDLFDMLWEGQFVEENNLTVHIAALRKALGETKNNHRYIVTVPGKGYRFVGEFAGTQSGEVIIEDRKFERIVIDEEIEEVHTSSGEPQNEIHLPATQTGRRSAAPVLLIAAAAVVLLGSGFALFNHLAMTGASAPAFEKQTVRQLTTKGNVGMAALSPDGKLFAYTTDDLGQKSLWVGYIDGGNHLLINPPADAVYRSLVFSPDNTHLYYSLREGSAKDYSLMKIPVFGGVQQKVLDNVGAFSLSPDGTEVAVVRPGDSEDGSMRVTIFPANGSAPREVARLERSNRFMQQAISWSKDGSKLATVIVGDERPLHTVFVLIDRATGAINELKHDKFREITKTAWLDDGNTLIITAIKPESHSSVPQYKIYGLRISDGTTWEITTDRSNYGESWHNDAGVSLSLSSQAESLISVEHRQTNNIWVAPVEDLRNAKQITFGSFGKYDGLWGLDWTPDGKLIYTTSDTESQYIAQMDADGTNQKAITSPGHVDSVLTVGASGKHILFHSNRGGDFGIWRIAIDGTDLGNLTPGGPALHPAPSPDGKWVYFKSLKAGQNGWLCRVPFDGGEEECLTDTDTWWPSFSPQGEYFAATMQTDKIRLAIFAAGTNKIVRQIDLPRNATGYMGTRWTADGRSVTLRDDKEGYWNFPIDGGEPYKLDGLPKERLYNFSWSRDGKYLAFVRGQELRDVVLIQSSK